MKLARFSTFLLVIFAIGIVLLYLQANSRSGISHDEGISYLAATGHQALYHNNELANRWVHARYWQSFWTPDEFWIFSRISRDLAAWDIHPPLYFWILHVWCHFGGISSVSGPILNIVFQVLTVIIIYFICHLLFCSAWAAGTSAALFFLSGSILRMASQTRQYSFLGLIVACFLLNLIFFMKKPSWRRAVCLCLISALGVLTHYHFVLLLAILGFTAGMQLLWKKAWRHFYLMTASFFFAGLIFVALHPTFYLSFSRQRLQAETFAWSEVPLRFGIFIRSFVEFFVPYRFAKMYIDFTNRHGILLIILFLIGATTFYLIFKSRERSDLIKFMQHEKSLPLIGGMITAAALGFLYIFFVSPEHAMGAKYLILVAPLFFVLLAQLITFLSKKRFNTIMAISVVLLLSQVTYGSFYVFRFIEREKQLRSDFLNNANSRLILDSIARGVLPTVLWNANPNITVLAGSQEYLLKELLNEPLEGSILYANDLRYGNTIESRRSILKIFFYHGYKITQVRENIIESVSVYELRQFPFRQNKH